MPDTYFRWIGRKEDLDRAKAGALHSSASPNSACWIFDLTLWRPREGVSDDRVLVAFILNEAGQALMENTRKIRFPLPEFEGDAAHPDAIITKTNEPGAFGLGRNVVVGFNSGVQRTRLANVNEVARAINRPREHAQRRMRMQKW